ncbi:MAG: SIMPL domain-containing protein [Burkholderiaceae bacterium]
MNPTLRPHFSFVAAALVCFATAAVAQSNPPPVLRNVVQLSASASVDVRQDLLTMVLSTTREGPEPSAVQTELKTALDAALAEVKSQAEPGQLDVRTGNFSLYPKQNKDGRISAWQGRAELVLEGRDFARISAAAGRIQTLTVAQSMFGLSREQRAKVERETQQRAIQNFRDKSAEVAKSFGMNEAAVREVNIMANDQFPPPVLRMRSMAGQAAMSADAAIPVEAGNSTVTVTVQGSVQLN